MTFSYLFSIIRSSFISNNTKLTRGMSLTGNVSYQENIKSEKMLNKFKISSKGQMEIMGLVIIVILITLGLLFAALFAFNKETQKKVFTRKGLASSTMSAMLKSTVSPEEGCVETYIGRGNLPQLGEDILEDCALYFDEYVVGETIIPRGYSQFHCQGVHSCEFFKNKADELLQQSLGAWGKHYELRSDFIDEFPPPKELLVVRDASGIGCPWERDASGVYPIKVKFAGLVESQLYVCD
ncbi:MAG TPA: hypothetical protein VJI15_04310 [Candidatus Nanoarchaeia archaeon]|nr:hypothetical protein [Candidatus Nanoarchaeia archaeon]